MAESDERNFSTQNEEIMRATYRALRKYGYADLTIKRIAEEYGKSTAAVHYYYDTKDDLLAEFLDYLLEQFAQTVHDEETTDPMQELRQVLDRLLIDPDDHQNLLIAMLEMRSQAPYKEAFRERFQQNDEYARKMIQRIIDKGIEDCVFNDIDSEHAARTLMTIVDGARTREVVLDEADALETARKAAEEYISIALLN